MQKVYFSCNWGNSQERAWSGTSIALFRELNKYYPVERFDINVRVPLLFPLRCLEKLGLGRYDMIYMRYYNRKFARRHRKEQHCTVFQMDECPNVDWADSYIFQDLSVSYLLDIYEHRKDLIPYLGIENLNKRYLEKRFCNQEAFYQKAKGIFTMGTWLAKYLVENCGIPQEKVHAVGGGINVDATLIDDSRKSGNKILFVGRDFKRKGGDLVVSAFQILRSRNPRAELYITGPSHNPIAEKDMCDGIYFLGEQGKSELNELYNRCDIFCMPSRFEAYGLVFAEALVFGLPCVARNAFSMKEFIHEGVNGYLIENDDVQLLADKLEMALGNQEMKEYVRSQREWYVREYSWETVGKRIIEVMHEDESYKESKDGADEK